MSSPYRTEPPGARDDAFRILLRVEKAGAYASILLDQAEERFSDSRDVALLHKIESS